MKKLLALITVIAVSSSPVFAGCGKTVTNEGTLKSFDAATKTLVVAGKDGKEAKITLTPTTKGADSVAGMVGKSVKVDHAEPSLFSPPARLPHGTPFTFQYEPFAYSFRFSDERSIAHFRTVQAVCRAHIRPL